MVEEEGIFAKHEIFPLFFVKSVNSFDVIEVSESLFSALPEVRTSSRFVANCMSSVCWVAEMQSMEFFCSSASLKNQLSSFVLSPLTFFFAFPETTPRKFYCGFFFLTGRNFATLSVQILFTSQYIKSFYICISTTQQWLIIFLGIFLKFSQLFSHLIHPKLSTIPLLRCLTHLIDLVFG